MKVLQLIFAPLLFIASACSLLEGDSGGGGDGDGDGGGNSLCGRFCREAASCTADDPSGCTSECEEARQTYPACASAYDAFLRCIDPCDQATAASCDSQLDAYATCISDVPPAGTGGLPGGTGGLPGGTGGLILGSGGLPGGSGGLILGSGGSAPTGPASTFAVDGFGTTPNGWSGYLWTAVDDWGGVITPTDGFVGTSLCAEGYTGADWAGFGIIGFNIAQEVDPETLAGGLELEIAPSGTGVSVDVVNRGGSSLRVQIQNNSGTFWCAAVPGSGTGLIPWGSFNTQCWTDEFGMSNTGAFYAGEPISQVMVQAPSSSNLTQTPFDFCVISLDTY